MGPNDILYTIAVNIIRGAITDMVEHFFQRHNIPLPPNWTYGQLAADILGNDLTLTGRGVSQKVRPPKITTTKIRIVIRSFDYPFMENLFWGPSPYIRKIGLPESRVLYTML
ncbi:ribosomal protein S10, mitochondrial [Gossypium australe]|uniref:Ribosomal protein S10, mitochondrial n=1 Tax=Gossypium australe TaxID=47621 RepID=A0A5B6WY74_9ROSI|nr:ribosomal protein S10, mitochondrial [Gossypium australe]